jgi:hypothetical protein
MSEAEIRAAIEQARQQLKTPTPPLSTGWSRARKVAATAAVGLGLSLLTACYGAPMPRPPRSDASHQLNPGQLESPLKSDAQQATPAKP